MAQKIGGSYGSNQFPVRPVLEMLLADTPTKSTRAQREKEAFIRLVKGYMDWDVGGENENRKLVGGINSSVECILMTHRDEC